MDSLVFDWRARFLHPNNGSLHTELNRVLAAELEALAQSFAKSKGLTLEEASLRVQREPWPPPPRPSRG